MFIHSIIYKFIIESYKIRVYYNKNYFNLDLIKLNKNLFSDIIVMRKDLDTRQAAI